MSVCLQFSLENDILYKKESNRLKLILKCSAHATISENIDILIPVGSEDSHMVDSEQFNAIVCTVFDARFTVEKKDNSFLLMPKGGSVILEMGEKLTIEFDNVEPSIGDMEQAMTFIKINTPYVNEGIQYLPLFKQLSQPHIIYFEAEKPTVGYGDIAVLRFKTSNISRCQIQPYHMEVAQSGSVEIPIYQDTKFFLIGYLEDKATLVQTVDVKLSADQGLNSFLVDGKDESVVDYGKDVRFFIDLRGTEYGYLSRGIGRVKKEAFLWKPNTIGDICQINFLEKKDAKLFLQNAVVTVGMKDVLEINMVYLAKNIITGKYQLSWTVFNAIKYVVTVWNDSVAMPIELSATDYQVDLPNYDPNKNQVDFACIGKYDQKIERFHVKEM